MVITYVFHSGFIIESDNVSIIVDYYKDSNQTEGAVKKLLEMDPKNVYVLSSHVHGDHFKKDILDWNKKGNIKYILSDDIYEEFLIKRDDITYLPKLGEYRDSNIFIKAFGSTDAGISFYIETPEKSIFHAGDLNNWHWNEEVDAAEAQGYEDNFLTELGLIQKHYPKIDIVLFPIDPRLGKDYMKGADQFTDKIKTGSFIPMHFQSDYDKGNAFKTIAREKGIDFIEILGKGQIITL